MTTMRRELGEPPPRATVVAPISPPAPARSAGRSCPASCGATSRPWPSELDQRFASREWLEEGGGLRRPGVRIHEGVRVGEGAHKAPGGLIRCVAMVRDDHLDDVAFSGDFTARPADVPADLDELLIGCQSARMRSSARVDGLLRTGSTGDAGRDAERLGGCRPAGHHDGNAGLRPATEGGQTDGRHPSRWRRGPTSTP